MVNFGPLAAEIVSLDWGTPAHFNGFGVLAALLHGILVVGVIKLCGVEQRAPPIFGRATITLGIGPHSSFFYLLSIYLLFFIPRLISAVADWMVTILLVSYTSCGLSANLECRSEMCCKRLAGNTGRKNDAKKSSPAHYRTTFSGYIFATKAGIDKRKKNLLSSNSQ